MNTRNQTCKRPSGDRKTRNRAFRVCGLALCLAACGCRTTYTTLVQDRDTLTQIAPFLFLLSGNYDGTCTVERFRAAGNLGIGTFQGLDGEAVLLDGTVYQITGDGAVSLPGDTRLMPFGACTLFDEEERMTLRHVASFEQFRSLLEARFRDKPVFYAIRAHGAFDFIRVRSCDKQQKPYPPLAEATRYQHEYTYRNTRGTLVGFWTPPFVPGSIGVPGFHLHFLSDDRSQGGHVLDFAAPRLALALDATPRITIDFSMPIENPLLAHDIKRLVHESEKGRTPQKTESAPPVKP